MAGFSFKQWISTAARLQSWGCKPAQLCGGSKPEYIGMVASARASGMKLVVEDGVGIFLLSYQPE